MNLIQKNATLIGTIDGYHFGISDHDRARNVHIVGKTGTGKTKLLFTMLNQDVYNKKPFVFFDYWGDSMQFLLDKVPNYNIDQIFYVDPDNSESIFGIDYLTVAKSNRGALVSRIVENLKYRNVIDERVGVVFDVRLDYFHSTKDREEFVDIVLSAWMSELDSRKTMPTYQKPMFTFYLDEFQFLKPKTIRNLLDSAGELNSSVVSAHQFFAQVEDKILEDIFLMYGNHIFTNLVGEDSLAVSKIIKYVKPEEINKLQSGQAVFRIFSDGERQREFIAQLYSAKFPNFDLGKIIKNK